MKTLKSLVSWIEIPVTDMNRAKKFYEAILQVKLQDAKLASGLEMSFFPVEQTGTGGALCCVEEHYRPSKDGVVIYLTADPDIDTMLELVEKSGGRILQQKKQILESSDYGHMALFIDTEGNRIALYQGNKQ